MFFDHYPYTNFHNINLDWVLQAVKAWGQTVEANDRAFQDLKEANEDFKAYVTNYLQDLDITDEINTKLDTMLASGVLTPYFAPYVQGYVNSWLNSHVTPTSPALDNTLSLSGAAARADATGSRLKDLAYIDALSTPEVYAAINRSQVMPGYRVQGVAYDYDGHFYVCGGSVDGDGTGVIVKMSSLDFKDAEMTVIQQLGHANDITYYNGYLYVCTVGGGDAPQWGIYKINVNDFTDKTLISNAPENTIGITYRQGDFWLLAPYRIYRTTDFTSYEVIVDNTNNLMTAYGIPTDGRISQTIFRAAGYLIGWVCSFVYEERHYGAITFFSSTGQPVAFKMFPAYHTELQGAVYAHMSIWLLADGNLVNVFRMDPRHLSYIQLKAGDDLNDFTGRGTLYSTGSNVSSELINAPSAGEGFTVQVERLGVYNTIQTARTNSGRELYRIKSFNSDTWGEWIEPAAEVSQIKEDLNAISPLTPVGLYGNDILPSIGTFTSRPLNGISYTWNADNTECAVSGTATALSFLNIYNDQSALPEGISAGDLLNVEYSTTDNNLVLQISFYDADATRIILYTLTEDMEVSVPTNAVGAIIRLRVSSGITINAIGSGMGLYVFNDATADILSKLNTYGVCYLSKGVYPVKGLDMPDGSTIEGCGAESVIRLVNSDFENRYVVKMGQKCAIKDVTISGPDSHNARTVTSATVGSDVGVLWSGSDGVYPTNGIISDVRFLNIKGSGIKCTTTSMATYRKCAITGCNFENCDAGINIDDVSEFHHISDCSFYGCYYGVINNGGNNRFNGCVFGVNAVHMMIDGTHENAAHSGATNCVFAHAFGFDENGNTVSNAGVALRVKNVTAGYLFTGCQFGFGSIDLTGSKGIMFTGCLWSGASNKNIITIIDGSGTFFNGCEFAYAPTINISNNNATRLINCYTRDGAVVTV